MRVSFANPMGLHAIFIYVIDHVVIERSYFCLYPFVMLYFTGFCELVLYMTQR